MAGKKSLWEDLVIIGEIDPLFVDVPDLQSNWGFPFPKRNVKS